MRQIIGASLVLSAIWFIGPGPAEAQTWLCKQADGTEVFTNTQEQGCTRYEPKSELGRSVGGAMGQPDRDDYPSQPAAPSAEVQAQAQTAGQITFEQFRMLSRGMTEGQVLSKLGSPISKTTLSCTAEKSQGQAGSTTTVVCPILWTYTMPEGWVADLTFIAGRLAESNNSKPQ
jgi:hypothetical protein